MAKQRGRGLAAIEYPTGMNQGGDPSQAWIKIKPDGRVDVFAGTVDIGQGSKTVHTQIVADTLGVPYDWVTMDVSNTDSSPALHGHVRLARHVHRRQRRALRGGAGPRAAARHRRPADRDRPVDLEVVEGEVLAKGAPDKKISDPGRRRRGDVGRRRDDHGQRRGIKP